jgi:transposase
MSKIRHTLQLLHSGNLSIRQIGAALGISKSTVSEIASYTRAAGLDWAQTQNLSDEELQARLYRPPVTRQARHLEPDYAQIHSELKRAGVTLQLLWEEYQQQHQGEAYKYSAFCEKYRQWAKRLKRSMRQTHEAGDKLFVDYAGQTVPVVDANTGEITQAQVFVAVLAPRTTPMPAPRRPKRPLTGLPASLPPLNLSVAGHACWYQISRVR